MEADQEDAKRIDEWLALLGGPGARPQSAEVRDRGIAEMCAAGADRLLPLLIPKLIAEDPEVRCAACEAVLRVDAVKAITLVLPLLDDPEVIVRWQACGCLHDFGDERAIDPLIRVLQCDSDAQVRGTAAYSLGGIGSPAAIPALLAAMESDHDFDELGHSASSCAASALDDILGANETRIRVAEGLYKMQSRPADLELLKRLAREKYEEWCARNGRSGDTAN